jgi:pantothenate kinase type III
MSLLVIDAGHSRLKVHLYTPQSTTRCVCPLKPFTWPKNLPAPKDIAEVLLMGTNERHLVRLRSHLSQLNFPIPAQLGIDLMVPTSSATPLLGVGNDRLANVLGASLIAKHQPCLILSAGSAITLDRINAKGQHDGGLIGIGWAHYREAMLAINAKLVSSADPALTFPGKKTEDAVALGWKESILGMVERLRQPKELIYITGGDASRLLSFVPESIHVPYLSVDGMAQQLGYGVSVHESIVDLTLTKSS